MWSSYYQHHGQLWDSLNSSLQPCGKDTHQTGARCNSQSKQSTVRQATYQEPAPGHADESLKTFFLSLSLSSFSSRYLSLCWWSILTECENGCIATVLLSRSPLPWLFWCGRLLEETLWRLLFIGKGHSHICIWSLWETERMREKHEGYSQFSKRNNLSCHPSHFSTWTNKGRKRRGKKGGGVYERLCPDSLFLAHKWKKKKKKPHLEIRQADPNWIKSIWILLSLLFPQCTQYYPPFPVTVSWAACITQLLVKKKNTPELRYRFLRFNNWAANAEQWRPCCSHLRRWKCISLKACSSGGGGLWVNERHSALDQQRMYEFWLMCWGQSLGLPPQNCRAWLLMIPGCF